MELFYGLFLQSVTINCFIFVGVERIYGFFLLVLFIKFEIFPAFWKRALVIKCVLF